MMPPMIVRVAIYEGGKRKINLWLPLLLLYVILFPFLLLTLPFLLLGGLVLWIFGGGRTPFSVWVGLYELWCASKGIVIEAKSKNDRVLVRIV